ncbi:MAG: glycosyltransferase family 4 protein [Desulfobacterales bacterium]|nr:glycosyltransferase family 4 protein [Desulfobacterales bacterium]
MRIAFYTPFKPLGHAHPSGDLVIAAGLYRYLSDQGHEIIPVTAPRTRWIYWKPWRWPAAALEHRRAIRLISREKVDLWLTYHTYYKAPDPMGAPVSATAGIPYVIFQGIFSTKRRRRLKTLPGFLLNRYALRAARHVFSNRCEDLTNLKRLIPMERLTYVAPGIFPGDFTFDAGARKALRRAWGVGRAPVVLAAAMFRPDVKTEGLSWVIRSCGRLLKKGRSLHLVIAGDGREKETLRRLAREHCPDAVRFVGKIPREKMNRFYSAGDVFAFPGIRESLGMVYLESQSCGLPVVAFDNGGIPEVVKHGKTGFLTPLYNPGAFDDALEKLLLNKTLRREMGREAGRRVRRRHDLNRNYREVARVLENVGRNG